LYRSGVMVFGRFSFSTVQAQLRIAGSGAVSPRSPGPPAAAPGRARAAARRPKSGAAAAPFPGPVLEPRRLRSRS
jgi:hypothetical protein